MAGCCSTPATACSPRSAPRRPARTTSSARSAPGSAFSSGEAARAGGAPAPWRGRFRRACRRPHRHRAARRWRRCRGQHPRRDGERRGTHGAERTARPAAHQPRQLSPRARPVRGHRAGADQVKGVEQPLRSYLVDAARPRAFRAPTRGIEGVQTRMVGRDAELDVLRAAFDAAVACAAHARSPSSAKPASARAGCWPNSSRPEPARACGCCSAAPIRAAPCSPMACCANSWRGSSRSPRRTAELARSKLLDGLGPLFAAEGEGADPSARSSDRARLLDQPACGGGARRRAGSQRARLRCRRAEPAPPRREQAGGGDHGRPALGRRRLAAVHAPSAARETATRRCSC